GLVQLLVPLVHIELQRVARGPAIIMRRPAIDLGPVAIGPPGEESLGPIDVVAIGPGCDQERGRIVLRQPLDEASVRYAVILGDELAPATPTLVADAPEPHPERIGMAVGRSLIRQARRTGRGIAVFHPLLEFLRRTRADIAREVGLHPAEPAEPQE